MNRLAKPLRMIMRLVLGCIVIAAGMVMICGGFILAALGVVCFGVVLVMLAAVDLVEG